MSLIVQKFGGSSVENPQRILKVAQTVIDAKLKGYEVVVIVSAMGDTTDYLIELSQKISVRPTQREMDSLLSTGELISIATLAMAINSLGHSSPKKIVAHAFTGSQAGIITDQSYGFAHIERIEPKAIKRALIHNVIPVVAGFQGIYLPDQAVTTLGRGGSDLSAVALSAALEADICEIYTDVDGIFTIDPRLDSKASKFDAIRSDSLLELSASGAKVVAPRAVEYARRNQVTMHVRSSYSKINGTIVNSDGIINSMDIPNFDQDQYVKDLAQSEDPLLYGIATDHDHSKITVYGVEDKPGVSAHLFTPLARAGILVDLVVQNSSAKSYQSPKKITDISFTVQTKEVERAIKVLESLKEVLQYSGVGYDSAIAKVSLVGASIKNNPNIFAQTFSALAKQNINIEMISTSEIRITLVIKAEKVKQAAEALHTEFGLDSKAQNAIVYAGSGR
ncbi:MAG: aspartate kinase [Bifidobacteriaceae bacterium]|jgi:aspartate kinase|nr:aspartate kinase [Bifidobacteriaceae bacterium]